MKFDPAAAERFEPVHGAAQWLSQPLGNGTALVEINGVVYELARHYRHQYKLTRQGAEAEVYYVDLGFERCTCADARYRRSRPGGYKHVRALKALLGNVRF